MGSTLASTATLRRGRVLARLTGAGLIAVALSVASVSAQASVRPHTPAPDLYAYAAGTGSPSGCPVDSSASPVPSNECSLTAALAAASAGRTIILANVTVGSTVTAYVGNFTAASGTADDPVTITTEDGDTAVLSGNGGSASGCSTTSCAGPILTVDSSVGLDVSNVAFEDADNASGPGGAIDNNGDLQVSDSQFTSDDARNGGAIDNADGSTATLTVSDSTFTNDTAHVDGGAIDNGDSGGQGTLSVGDSTFTSCEAVTNNGGAIDSGDGTGSGTVTVVGSIFFVNTAPLGSGGAISSSPGTTGSLSVTDSSFQGNSSGYEGGAIDNGDFGGNGTLDVTTSSFTSNSAETNGGAIDNADGTSTFGEGSGNVTISQSTFTGNVAFYNGGAIDSGDGGGTGVVSIGTSTFRENSALHGDGGGINSGDDGQGTLGVSDSSFVSNTSNDDGGAIDGGDNQGHSTISVDNSTFSHNSTISADFDGGAIDLGDHLGDNGGLITQSTFVGNSTLGQGASIDLVNGGVIIAGDILASGAHASECGSGRVTDGGSNVVDDSSCLLSDSSSVASSTTIDGFLGPLGNYGGPTPTVPLLATSSTGATTGDPAVGDITGSELVPESSIHMCTLADQRGDPRTASSCDAGAFSLVQSSIGVSFVSSLAYGVVTVQATIDDASDPVVATGGVTIAIGSGSCQITLSYFDDGVGACHLPVTSVGNVKLTATYTGDLNHTAATLSQTVNVTHSAPKSLTVSLSKKKITVGSEAVETLSVTVVGTLSVPTGKVIVWASPAWLNRICQVNLSPSKVKGATATAVGTCTLTASQLKPGTYPVTGVYAGNTDYLTAISPAASLQVVH